MLHLGWNRIWIERRIVVLRVTLHVIMKKFSQGLYGQVNFKLRIEFDFDQSGLHFVENSLLELLLCQPRRSLPDGVQYFSVNATLKIVVFLIKSFPNLALLDDVPTIQRLMR